MAGLKLASTLLIALTRMKFWIIQSRHFRLLSLYTPSEVSPYSSWYYQARPLLAEHVCRQGSRGFDHESSSMLILAKKKMPTAIAFEAGMS